MLILLKYDPYYYEYLAFFSSGPNCHMTHWQGASLLFLILSMYSFTLAHGIQVVMTSTMCQYVHHLNTKSTISKLEHSVQYLCDIYIYSIFGFYMHYQGLCFYKDYNIYVIIIIHITVSKLQMSCNTFMDLFLFCLKSKFKNEGIRSNVKSKVWLSNSNVLL